MTILQAQVEANERGLCRCGRWATSELSYTEEMVQHEGASSLTPPSSPPTNNSYQTPPVEAVTTLLPVPEDIQLPSLTSSEIEPIPIPPPRAPTPGRQVGSQCCWTHRKTDEATGSGAARLFQSSTGIRGKARARPYTLGSHSSVRGSGNWRVRAEQHSDAPERCAPSPRFFND